MPSALEIPTPDLLYVHENLLPHVRERFGELSSEYQLANAFIAHIAAQPNVQIGTLKEELDSLQKQVTPKVFDIAFGFGTKGEAIAKKLHKRWGCFPNIKRLDITRVEIDDKGNYKLVSKTDIPIKEQISNAGEFKSVAIVDDVLFTGFTVFSVLDFLKLDGAERVDFFFTRGMAKTKRKLESEGKNRSVYLGISLEGEPEKDVSTISSMNMITKGAIHSPTEGDITYCQRQEWVEAWFPKHTENVVDLCQVVTNLVQSFSPREESEETIVQ